MSIKTTNFEFIKPEKTDPADITATNENWDKLDEALIRRDEDLSMGGHKITDVAEPVSGSDVATRHFVEQHSIEGNTYVAVDYNKDGNITLKPYVADEDELTFKSHIANEKNPHNVTKEQIGAAPSGCGYGDKMVWLGFDGSTWKATGTFQEDLEALFASMPQGTCRQVQFIDEDGLNTQKFTGTLWKYTAQYGTLTALNYSGLKAVRTFYSGKWNDWEWENPPMTPGVPYRTTKRYNEKPVYVLYQNVGNMPSSGKKEVYVASGSGVMPSNYLSFQTFYNGAGRIHNGNIFVNDEGTLCGRVDIQKTKTIELVAFNNKISDYTISMLIEYTLD